MLGFSSAVSSSGSSKTSSTGKSLKPEILADDLVSSPIKGTKLKKNILADLKLYRIKIYQTISKYIKICSYPGHSPLKICKPCLDCCECRVNYLADIDCRTVLWHLQIRVSSKCCKLFKQFQNVYVNPPQFQQMYTIIQYGRLLCRTWFVLPQCHLWHLLADCCFAAPSVPSDTTKA